MLDARLLFTFPGAKRVPPGTIVATEGDASGGIGIILLGKAGVYKNYLQANQVQFTPISQGDFFGEDTLLNGSSHNFTIVALTEIILLEINQQNIYEFITHQPDATLKIMQHLCNRRNVAIEPSPQSPQPQKVSAPKPVPAAPVPSAPASSAPASSAIIPSELTSLFPEGHGAYKLPQVESSLDFTYEKSFTCPICKASFKALVIKNSKLVSTGSDSDLRTRYKAVEPLYYDIIVCPSCLFSAQSELFPTGTKTKALTLQSQTFETLKSNIKISPARDSDAVFTSFYLAVLCAPLCFSRYQLILANLWMKLSRLYSDCSDDAMVRFAAQRSYDESMSAYEKLDISPAQNPQLCNLIGEMCFRLADYKNSRSFFFKVKIDKMTSPMLKKHAEDRIEEIRILLDNPAT